MLTSPGFFSKPTCREKTGFSLSIAADFPDSHVGLAVFTGLYIRRGKLFILSCYKGVKHYFNDLTCLQKITGSNCPQKSPKSLLEDNGF